MKHLARARFMVLPSQWYEGVPMVLLEAMSASKPSIVSSIGVLPEMIRDGINGLVFAPGAREELSERMKRLYADPEGAREMGKKGRALFEEKYTREVNYSMLMEAYQKAIEIRNGKIRRKG
jgi:glycosyltransferase involved in cell wall biosynthesis